MTHVPGPIPTFENFLSRRVANEAQIQLYGGTPDTYLEPVTGINVSYIGADGALVKNMTAIQAKLGMDDQVVVDLLDLQKALTGAGYHDFSLFAYHPSQKFTTRGDVGVKLVSSASGDGDGRLDRLKAVGKVVASSMKAYKPSKAYLGFTRTGQETLSFDLNKK